MSHTYVPVQWNHQKRRYDWAILVLILVYLSFFGMAQALWYPEITAETFLIRATGSLAFLMLHVILAIGPLARLNPHFLPLLYNRRHLGVSMFLIALVHGVLNMIQFHTLGDTDPITSLFTSNLQYGSFINFPFQVLGFFALLILLLMASTSHDFWLNNLSPKLWKSLHMMVYLAYALLLLHVMLGAFQNEQSQWWFGGTALGLLTLIILHLSAAFTNKKQAYPPGQGELANFVHVCAWEDIEESRAKTILIGKENIAVFKHQGLLSAVSNLCRHQNGPLGEGKIVDGCITCPWHGYQYRPEDGQAPPPFTEKLETYDVKVLGGEVYVNPSPYPPGTPRPLASHS